MREKFRNANAGNHKIVDGCNRIKGMKVQGFGNDANISIMKVNDTGVNSFLISINNTLAIEANAHGVTIWSNQTGLDEQLQIGNQKCLFSEAYNE